MQASLIGLEETIREEQPPHVKTIRRELTKNLGS